MPDRAPPTDGLPLLVPTDLVILGRRGLEETSSLLPVHGYDDVHGPQNVVEVLGGVDPAINDDHKAVGRDLQAVEAGDQRLEDPMEDLRAGQVPREELGEHRDGSRGDQPEPDERLVVAAFLRVTLAVKAPVLRIGEEVGGVPQEPVQREALPSQGPEDILLDAVDRGGGEDGLPLGIGP